MMRILSLALLMAFMVGCSVHMHVPGKPGRGPGGVVIIVPPDQPDVKPIPDK